MANPSDGFLIAGMAEAFTFVDALKAAGKNLTRKGLMTAVTHMNEANNPFLVPGVTVHTTPTYRFPISSVQLQRWHSRPLGAVRRHAVREALARVGRKGARPGDANGV